MGRVLFLGLNARYVHSNLAVMYLEKVISPLYDDTVIIERSINEKNDRILADLAALSPSVVAISVYIWNTVKVRELIPGLRTSLPGVVIVLGGPDAGYCSDRWFESDFPPDYIVAGAGEAGFLKLAGSGFDLKEKLVSEKNIPLEEVPFPYNTADMERLAGKVIYYESSRGCPYRCSYCLSSRADHRLEFRPFDMVSRELDFLVSFNPGLIKFIDRTFNSSKEHYRPIWEYIAERFAGGVTVFHFEVYPGQLDDHDLDFLVSVPPGLFQFEIGIQSVNSVTLRAIHRVMDSGAFEIIERLIRMGNIRIHLDLIAGLPFEDYAGFRNSFDRVIGLNPHRFQPGMLKVLPGTEMMERVEEYGLNFSPVPPYTVRSTGWLSGEEMERISRIAELVEHVYNTGKFKATCSWLCEVFGGVFAFYEKLCSYSDSGSRSWYGSALQMAALVNAEKPEQSALLMDYLRWDWCTSGTRHHYPGMLKSDFTVEVKRSGYNFFIRQSKNNIMCAGSITFTRDELRRSIFFAPETAVFRENMMRDEMALFLPDKRVIFFNTVNFISDR